MKGRFFLVLSFLLVIQSFEALAITSCLKRIKQTLTRSRQYSLDLDKDFKKVLSEIREEYLLNPHRVYNTSGSIPKGTKYGVNDKVYQVEYFLGGGAEGENYVVRELIEGRPGEKKVLKFFKDQANEHQKENIELLKFWRGRGIPTVDIEVYSPLQKLAVIGYREGVALEYLFRHPNVPDFRKQQLRHLFDVMNRKAGGDLSSFNTILDIKNGEIVVIDAI
ncbi:MAG: hypothetical protein JNM93_00835 [Bacteriovoracaceae bacterium]|nr:hypothetical protein [Bacteriovoracaceae bacterium]